MSFTTIPNQPVNLVGSTLQGCLCDPLTPNTLIGSQDQLQFAVRAFSCANATQLLTQDFTSSDWRANIGFVIAPGSACCSTGNAGASLTNNATITIPGETYELRLNFTYVQGTIEVAIGGLVFLVTEPGQYSYTFTATSTQRLRITLVDGTSLMCLDNAQLFEGNKSLTVDLIDPDTEYVMYSVNAADDPEAFSYSGDSVVVTVEMAEAGITGCFRVRLTDCDDEVGVTSQTFQVISDTSCTLLFSACNDYAAMGLPEGFTPRMRANAKLVRPSWEYDVSEERRSNGRWSRHYADRQTRYELRIDLQSEFTLPFISAWPVFHHFYVGQQEFSIDPEAIEPTYQDVFDGTGGVVLSVRPKQELLRNVRCEAENEAGCPPPPNYLVQGTGPNTDYILTQAGDRILLA